MDTNQFLSAIYELIRLNYPWGRPEGVTAARVGFLVRQAFPDLNWENIGFPKLKHILAELESQGLIRTGLNQKQALAIWLPSEGGAGDVVVSPATSRWPSRQTLRKEVWNAFVRRLPLGRRFLHRRNGVVRMAATDPPDSSGEWTEIAPIDQDTQKSWARDFLATNDLLDDPTFSSALETDDWYRQLPDELKLRDAALLSSWNYVRSQNVIGTVRKWGLDHAVPENVLFEYSESSVGERTLLERTAQVSPDIRGVILRAIGRMATDELLQIAVPAKYLLAALGFHETNVAIQSRGARE